MLSAETSLKDVFISYSSMDDSIVRRIAERMREAGVTSFFAPADIPGGANFVEKISDGLQQSQMVVLFLSQSALDSFWVQREWSAQLVRMAHDRTAGLLPILLPGVDEAQLSPLLRVQNRLDFRACDLNDPDVLEQSVSTIVDNIRADVPDLGSPVIGLPFVVFAMNSAEAAALQSGKAFDDESVAPAERTAFQRLVRELERQDLTDLSSCYGEFREDWRPPVADGVSARKAISDVVSYLNELRADRTDLPVMRPQFFSEDFLSDDARWRERTWDVLSGLGCVCVIDSISLFHPKLRRMLERSEFGSTERVSLVFVPPANPQRFPVTLMVEDQIKSHMPRAYARFETHFDLLCELSAPDIRHIKRWLFSVLPEVARQAQGERASVRQKQAMREMVQSPTRTAQKIFGWNT
jgi:TIR domain-containing protein